MRFNLLASDDLARRNAYGDDMTSGTTTFLSYLRSHSRVSAVMHKAAALQQRDDDEEEL